MVTIKIIKDQNIVHDTWLPMKYTNIKYLRFVYNRVRIRPWLVSREALKCLLLVEANMLNTLEHLALDTGTRAPRIMYSTAYERRVWHEQQRYM